VADDGAAYLGPFASTRSAALAASALHEALPLRPCTLRLSATSTVPACALAELGRCSAPCEHRISVEDYAIEAAMPFREATTADLGPLVERLLRRIERFSAAERFEDAAAVRERLVVLLRATIRMQRLRALTDLAEVIAARPADGGGWELAVIRHGRLAAAGTSPRQVHPRATIDVMLATAESVRPGTPPTPAATAEETERILAWIERSDARLVAVSDGWALPASGAARFSALLKKAESAGGLRL
jgi:DNA polymerase III subunit epsilon